MSGIIKFFSGKKFSGRTLIILLILAATLINYLAKTELDQASIRTAYQINNPDSHMRMAAALLKVNDWQAAKKETIKAHEIISSETPMNTSLWNEYQNLAVQVYRKENLNDQINYWEKLIKNQPTYRDGYLELSFLYYQLNYEEPAFRYWKKAKEIDPNNKTVLEMESLFKSYAF